MIDQEAAGEDSQILRKDFLDKIQTGFDKPEKENHSRMMSLSLS